MTAFDALRSPLGVDPLTVAGAFGALAGLASLGVPYFEGLAEALAALAAVAWMARHGRVSGHRSPGLWPTVGFTATAWSFALLTPAPFSVVRGAVLGASAAVLAWQARHVAPLPEEGG
ncbi:MAG: hypothetical protein L3K00_04285 [Thermoplasmata archaeon]|nr:hypothetical protein [Thermoplasmata archaeon]MCI4361839.1 hypothetical protein [Thermoplasmata archaeon]